MPGYGFHSKSEVQKLKDSGFKGVRASQPGMGGPRRYTPPKKQSTDRRAELPNNEGKRNDDLAALSYFQYDVLDRAQTNATPGDTLPIIFGERLEGEGGVWVSPPLVETASVNFERTFVYVISEGRVEQELKSSDFFLGKTNIADIVGDLGFAIDAELRHGDGGGNTCPFSGTISQDLSCDGISYKGAIDTMAPGLSSAGVIYRVIGEHASSITFRAKPLPTEEDLYDLEYNFPVYGIVVYRLPIEGFASDDVSIAGVITTNADGSPAELTDSDVGNTYSYFFNTEAIASEEASNEVGGILLEVQQDNAFPESPDRTKLYRNMTLLVVRGDLYNSGGLYSDPKGLKQLHFYCTSGKMVNRYRTSGVDFGPSNRFSDLAAMFIEESKNFVGEGIDTDSCKAMAQFHRHYKMYFNGVISSTSNFLSYIQEVSPYFLCALVLNAGVYQFVPVVPLNSDNSIATGALTPAERFDDSEPGIDRIADAIIMESYERTYIDSVSRRPFIASVSYRDINDHGMEVFKTVSVRYDDYPNDAPEEAFDLTAFATNRMHAETFAKYLLATRRYSSHMVSFSTPRNFVNASDLKTYDLIEVSLNRVNSEGDNVVETDHYLVTDIEAGSNGINTVQAEHFPLAGGSPVISTSIVTGNFVIDQ